MGRKILAIDVGGTAIKSGLLEDGKILSQSECASNGARGAQALMDAVCAVASGYKGFERIGISQTGWVDCRSGVVVYAGKSIPGLTGTPVRSILEERFQVPVAVENDVNCAALGELHYGAARGRKDFLCLTYGTGIGGSIVINGEVYHGDGGSAGAFGHFITHAGGRPCSCGYTGCYEAYASTRALVNSVHNELGGEWNGRTIFERFYAGDEAMVRLVNSWMDEVSLGLVSVIHIFNPGCILLGGGVMNEDYVVREVSRRVHARIMPNFQGVQLLHASLGNRAGMLGACYIAENC